MTREHVDQYTLAQPEEISSSEIEGSNETVSSEIEGCMFMRN
jgi:hypothetical protein